MYIVQYIIVYTVYRIVYTEDIIYLVSGKSSVVQLQDHLALVFSVISQWSLSGQLVVTQWSVSGQRSRAINSCQRRAGASTSYPSTVIT